jgi:hypothetical protein
VTEAVTSVLNQTYQDFEIIIVDPISTDETPEVCRAFLERFADKRLTVIRQENMGMPAISRNLGIERAQGKYILCLDADDKISDNYIFESVKLLESNKQYSICYSNLKHFGQLDSYLEHKEYDNRCILRMNYIPVASVFSKKCWEDAGGYRTNVTGYEDWDLWINSYSKGHFHRYSPESIFYYRKHSESMLADCGKKDRIHKANIILNNSKIFTEIQIKWAESVIGKTKSQIGHYDPGLGLIPLTQELIINNKQLLEREQSEYLNKIVTRTTMMIPVPSSSISL